MVTTAAADYVAVDGACAYYSSGLPPSAGIYSVVKTYTQP